MHVLTLGRTDLQDNWIAWPPELPSFGALSNQNEQWQHLAFEAAAGSLSGRPLPALPFPPASPQGGGAPPQPSACASVLLGSASPARQPDL